MANRGTQEERYKSWLARAQSKHGARFRYAKSQPFFQNQKSKITISCEYHGDFVSTGDKHVANDHGGCPKCGGDAKGNAKSKSYFAAYQKWLTTHLPDNLEIVSEFSGPSEPLMVRCKTHGTTKKTTALYIKNNKTNGCDACAREKVTSARQLTTEAIKEELMADLPTLITIIGVERGPQGTRVLASCSQHGDFLTTKGSLAKAKYACPECKRENSGYTSHRLARLIEAGSDGAPCQIGIMEVEVFGLKAIKVGVTIRTLEDRYKWYLKRIHWSATLPERLAYVLESRVHRYFAKVRDDQIRLAGMRGGKRWAGDTEIYLSEKLSEILNFVRAQTEQIPSEHIDYEAELSTLLTEKIFPSVAREKSTANRPKEIVGLDPRTKEVVITFPSISAAARAGYRNVSLVLNPASSRITAGGLEWRRKE